MILDIIIGSNNFKPEQIIKPMILNLIILRSKQLSGLIILSIIIILNTIISSDNFKYNN